MKERPLLFSAPMVCAIREGRKTQTRRVMKPQPWEDKVYGWTWRKGVGWPNVDMVPATQQLAAQFSPYGIVGDRLWGRETHMVRDRDVIYRADANQAEERSVVRLARKHGTKVPPWTPSIHMPRWASRILLEITGVRVERLQDISEDDIQSEGVTNGVFLTEKGRREAWQFLWERINGAESWAANPWVWVIEFKSLSTSHIGS